MSSSLYGEDRDLIGITIGETKYRVPKGLELLRCYQFLGFTISAEQFCWNGNCQNCAIDLGGWPGKTLSCQTPAVEGMEIKELPNGVSISNE